MVEFNYWGETIVLALIYSTIIIIPCILVGLLGRKMINKLGYFPSKTPAIQMSIFLQLVVIEFATFGMLMGFYHFFSS